jgi:hypothetical protein
MFCPVNSTFNKAWVDDGFTLCFFYTSFYSIPFTFIIIFGILQICLYLLVFYFICSFINIFELFQNTFYF